MKKINYFSELSKSSCVVVVVDDESYMVSSSVNGIPREFAGVCVVLRPGVVMSAEPIELDESHIQHAQEWERMLGTSPSQDGWRGWVVNDGVDTAIVVANDNWD